MHISKLLHTQTGRYILSMILGFGLASLFKVVCKGKNCFVYMAPPTLDETDIYKVNNKCYHFNNVSTTCDKNKKSVTFA